MITDRFALQAWSKAEALLADASAVGTQSAPGAIVHLAYYAMFHAARAALLREAGSAPKKHASVIGQFGHAVRERSVALRQAGHNLKEVEKSRIIADYDDVRAISAKDAQEALARAIAFLDLCAEEFGFSREPSSEDE